MLKRGLRSTAVWVFVGLVSACGLRLPHVEKVPVAAEQAAEAEANAREGDIQISRGEAYAALLRYLEAVKLDPNSAVFANKLAIAYAKLSYLDRARESVLRSIALNPAYSFGFNTLGTLDLLQGRWSRAVKAFERAIQYRPDIAYFYVNLANAHLQKNAIDKALAALRQAVTIDPEVLSRSSGGVGVGVQSASVPFNEAGQFYVLARIYAERGEDAMALDALKKAFAGGYSDINRLKKDKEFARLRESKEFQDLVEQFENGAPLP